MKMKFIFSTLLLLMGCTAFAQGQYTLRSKVLDGQKESLAGVSVQEVGANNGTVTDQDGNFVLKVSKESSMVKISFTGFKAIETPANKLGTTIIMNEDMVALQELVVIGYGSMRKKDVTGAVSSISSENLNKGPVTNPLQQISGKAAGVNITQMGSEPGATPSIRIRGVTSLIGGSDPLVVLDGVQGNLELLSQLPPEEIESVDILKDASATAIYGSRGAPGVILVTTKKSKGGASQVEYSGNVSVDRLAGKLDMMSAKEWSEQSLLWNVPSTENHGANTDWFDVLTQDGVTQNHNLAINGGTDTFNYRASLTGILQNGVVINSKNDNYIARLQATQKMLDNKLIFSFNLNSATAKRVGSPSSVGRAAFTSNLISNAYVSRPTDPVFNADGSYFTDVNVFQYINPYAVAEEVTNDQTINNTFGSGRISYELIKGLTLDAFGTWRKLDGNSGYYMPASSTVPSAIDDNGTASINNWHQDEKLGDLSATYKKTFGAHHLDGTIVYEWQKQTYNGNYTQMTNFIGDATTYNALQLGDFAKITSGDISSYKNDRKLISFLGRVNYSYLDRYLLTLSIRRDGSSVFGENHKWGNFPSASFAWRLSDEPFMKGISFLNDLKIRAGYGITGNQQGLSPQNSVRLVSSSGTTYFAGSQITNYAISQNDNADLRWETRYQKNIGLDFSVLNNRISGSVDAYSAITKNLLFNYTVPQPPYPYSSVVANIGSLLNEGMDFNFNFNIVDTRDFGFNLNTNLSLMRNKVKELSGTLNGVELNTDYVSWGYNSYLVKGKPIGAYYILKHEGKNANNEETVVDADANGTIDVGSQSKDRYYEGSALPTHTYAFTPTFRYKNFDLSMLFRGSGGNKIFNKIKYNFSLFESIGKSNMLSSAKELGLYTSKYTSDLWLEKGDYLRFDNLTLGYHFNTQKMKHVSNLRLSLTATNLALFTKYSGLDPELNTNGGSDSGTDFGIYPRTRTLSVGLNIILK